MNIKMNITENGQETKGQISRFTTVSYAIMWLISEPDAGRAPCIQLSCLVTPRAFNTRFVLLIFPASNSGTQKHYDERTLEIGDGPEQLQLQGRRWIGPAIGREFQFLLQEADGGAPAVGWSSREDAGASCRCARYARNLPCGTNRKPELRYTGVRKKKRGYTTISVTP